MKNWIRNILLLAGSISVLIVTPGCTTGLAQQWMQDSPAQAQEALMEATQEPEATPSPETTPWVGSKEMEAVVEQPQGPLSPSGKSYTYYDTVEPTYIDGVLLVNKEYALPRDYGDGADPEAYQAFLKLQAGARWAGYSMPMLSGYRSFDYQDELYNDYVMADGRDLANTYSAWPGHSEHQTGLAFDVGRISMQFANTGAGQWLARHAHEYGFIIRYPAGKEDITGYQYEPWHIRYLGVDLATKVYESGLCLEEYLGVA